MQWHTVFTLRMLRERIGLRFSRGGYDFRAVVAEMSQAIAGIVEARDLAGLLVGRLSELLRLPGAALLLPSEKGDLILVETRGWADDDARRPALSRGGGLAAGLLRAARPVTRAELTEILGDSALSEDDRSWLSRPETELWVPLVRRGAVGQYILGKLQGVLLLDGSAHRNGFNESDRRLVATLAWGAAVAAENVELFSALKRRAHEVNQLYTRLVETREEERKRLARELHDRVIQDLIDFLFLLETGTSPTARVEIQTLRERLRGVIDSVRQVCSDLRPSALDDLSLGLAVQGYVSEIRAKHGLNVTLRLTADGDDSLESLPEESRLCLFRVLQEALTNAHRHSGARVIDVEISSTDDRVRLAVRDDGRGFTRPVDFGALIREGRFGLAGAQERLSLVGGALYIESPAAGGTLLRADIPLRAERVLTPQSSRFPDEETQP